MDVTTPLAGVAVVEWSASIAGAYAGRLLRDAGARVLRVGGVPLGKSHELDRYLEVGKDRVAGGVDDLPGLAAEHDADIVVLELPDAPDNDLVSSFGDAVVVVITPWGLTGPWSGSGRPWTEFTLQLEAGSGSIRGNSTCPLVTGSSESLWLAGTMAAGAAAAALQGGPEGRVLDVPLLEITAYATNLFQDVAAAVVKTPKDIPLRRIRLSPSVEPARDGWVGFNLASPQNHLDFLALIERPEWVADPHMNNFLGRYEKYDEWTEAVRAWTVRHTVDEIVEKAARLRIPCAPVHNGQTVLADPQVVARGLYSRLPESDVQAPNPPMLLAGRRLERGAGAAPSGATGRRVGTGEPFAGLRVLDLGSWWVGAYVGSALGAFGADVVKIESPRRIDGSRTLGVAPTEDHWWEQGNFYLGANFDKRNVSLDLAQPEGRELLLRLIETADVLIENYAPRVMESLGLDWDAVHAINPRLVMLRMPAFGLSGPRRSMVGYAQTVEQFSGLCWRTGPRAGDPTNPSGPADPMGGATSFFALAVALAHARETGSGILVEAPLVESAMVMSAEQVLRWTGRGELLGRLGNRAEDADVQGIFAAAGTEQWVGVSVVDDQQWAALAGVVGAPGWLDDPGLADRAGRQRRADEIEQVVAAWVGSEEPDRAVERLLAAGVPAGRLRDARFIHEQPHLAGSGSTEVADLPYAGRIGLPTLPFRRVDRPAWLTRRPPLLGEHNDEILRDELGLDDDAVARLVERGVVGTAPVAS